MREFFVSLLSIEQGDVEIAKWQFIFREIMKRYFSSASFSYRLTKNIFRISLLLSESISMHFCLFPEGRRSYFALLTSTQSSAAAGKINTCIFTFYWWLNLQNGFNFSAVHERTLPVFSFRNYYSICRKWTSTWHFVWISNCLTRR